MENKKDEDPNNPNKDKLNLLLDSNTDTIRKDLNGKREKMQNLLKRKRGCLYRDEKIEMEGHKYNFI